MVDWDGLENRCGFTLTVGSNPTLSATFLTYAQKTDARAANDGIVAPA